MCSSTIQPSPNNPVAMSELTMSAHILSWQRNAIIQSTISAHGEEAIHKLLQNDYFRHVYESSVAHHGVSYIDVNDVLLNCDLLQKELKGVQISAESSDTRNNEEVPQIENEGFMSKLIISSLHTFMTSPMKMILRDNGKQCLILTSSLVDVIINFRLTHAILLHKGLATDNKATKPILDVCRLHSTKKYENIETYHFI